MEPEFAAFSRTGAAMTLIQPTVSCLSCLTGLALTLLIAAPARDFGVPTTPPDPLESFAAVLDLREAVRHGDFSTLLEGARKTGCNAVLCGYLPERLELCRRQGLRLMIDLLDVDGGDIRRPEHHDRVRAVCEQLQGDKGVWGYHLWSAPIDRFMPGGSDGINEALSLVRTWDASHPVWVGTHGTAGLEQVQGTPGLLASCDDPWPDDADTGARTLATLVRLLEMRIDHMGRWIHPHEDARCTLHTVSTSIACGMKAMIVPAGPAGAEHPCAAACAALAPLHGDLAAIDMPRRVFSTATTRTSDDRPKDPGLPATFAAFPDDSWLRVEAGEVLVGVFGYDEGWDALFVANHSAIRPQKVTLHVRSATAAEPSVEIFDPTAAGWRRLDVHKGSFSLELAPGGGELVRLLGVAPN